MKYNPHKRTLENHRVCCRQLLVRLVNDLLIRSVSRFSTKDQFNEVQSSQAHFWKPLIAFIDIGQHLECSLPVFLPLEKFPIAILGSSLSAPLEGTSTAILVTHYSQYGVCHYFSTRYQSQFSEVKSSQAHFWNPLSFSRQLLLRVVNDLLVLSVSRFSAKDQFSEVQTSQAHSWKPPSLSWKLLVRVENNLLIWSVSRFSTKDQFSKVKSSQVHSWKPPSLLLTVTRSRDKWPHNTEFVTIFYKDLFNEVQSSQAHFWKPPSLFSTVTRARDKWQSVSQFSAKIC